MNINDLKNIDLNNLDLKKIKAFAVQNKQFLAKVGVVLVSLFLLMSMIGGYRDQVETIKTEMTDLGNKVKVIADYEEVLKKSQDYYKGLPKKLDEDQISNELSDYASKSNIVISSLSQGDKKVDSFSSQINTQIGFSFTRYTDFLNFVKSVDDSPYSLKITSCALKQNESTGVVGKNENVSIDVEMSITYTEIKK